MKILSIESSCDETAAAITEDGRKVISSVIATQIDEHKLYGGVVPEIASRRHCENITGVCAEALEKADAECPVHALTYVDMRPAVYETVKVVDPPAVEAWDEVIEDQYVITCSCGETFESEDDFNSHKEINSIFYELKHIDATYKDVPEEGHYEGERTWVVDKKAYTETVVDSPEKVIYKCKCGAVKK